MDRPQRFVEAGVDSFMAQHSYTTWPNPHSGSRRPWSSGTHRWPTNARPELDQVELSPEHQAMLDLAVQSSRGLNLWKVRKQRETRRLLALSQLAGASRLIVMRLDLTDDLRVLFRLKVPVALRPGPDGKLRTADAAVLSLNYPRLVLTGPLPGCFTVTLRHPAHNAFYPDISTTRNQQLDLGQTPLGIPVAEIVIRIYDLLAMSTVQVESVDSAGVTNIDAAEWWRRNQQLMPLTREPFLPEGRGDDRTEDQTPCI